MDIMAIVKDKIEEIVEKIKTDKTLAAKFQENPIAAVESVLGVDLPDDQIKAIVDGVKAKMDMDKIGNVLGGLGGLFGK